jgi:hypothetical protein
MRTDLLFRGERIHLMSDRSPCGIDVFVVQEILCSLPLVAVNAGNFGQLEKDEPQRKCFRVQYVPHSLEAKSKRRSYLVTGQ